MKKLLLVVLLIISLLYVYPIIFTFTSSFMSYEEIMSGNIHIIPEEFNLQQYYSIITFKGEYFHYFLNSIKLTSIIIFGQVIIGIFAAFAFAKMDFVARNLIFILYILAILLPFQVTLVPNYLVFDKIQRLINIKIFDTHTAIILPGIFTSFGVILLRQFIRNIPNEIIETAMLDGASYTKILFKIVLPILRPAIFTLIILTFIDNWNLVEQAIIFLDSPSKLPLSVFLENIYYNDFKVFYAGAVLYIIPSLILFIKGEKYLMEGLNIGGLK
ncbi:carbohydrate ABC transporter permease [Thermohalobacter berrensis]|uniref:carbohydrate ABC transporter permease n=1 Tax=Thermohalobacter berrensis TaxID=99594 RepID=UPI000E750DA8|nr:carbohydrate ABC transporter permease [Thermohalobacter berrensis]